jgi:hypothetical protein
LRLQLLGGAPSFIIDLQDFDAVVDIMDIDIAPAEIAVGACECALLA